MCFPTRIFVLDTIRSESNPESNDGATVGMTVLATLRMNGKYSFNFGELKDRGHRLRKCTSWFLRSILICWTLHHKYNRLPFNNKRVWISRNIQLDNNLKKTNMQLVNILHISFTLKSLLRIKCSLKTLNIPMFLFTISVPAIRYQPLICDFVFQTHILPIRFVQGPTCAPEWLPPPRHPRPHAAPPASTKPPKTMVS